MRARLVKNEENISFFLEVERGKEWRSAMCPFSGGLQCGDDCPLLVVYVEKDNQGVRRPKINPACTPHDVCYDDATGEAE